MEAIKYEEIYSYRDYVEWEDRWELIDGIAYNMTPAPYPKHQRYELYQKPDSEVANIFLLEDGEYKFLKK